MAWQLYDEFRLKQAGGTGAVDLTAVVVKCALVTNTYVPDQNLDELWTDAGISANEVSGTGYTAGGNTVANVTAVLDGAGLVTIDGDDPATWAQDGAGFTDARYAVLRVDSTEELIAYEDFGADKGNTVDGFHVELDAAGIFTSARP